MAVITISRGTLSGGKTIAEMLAERLNYKCISREVVVSAAEKYGVPEHKLFEAIQKSPSFVQRLTFERERYLALIQSILCETVKDDNVVYHGHAGHFLLQGIAHVLKVRILASREFRMNEAMKRQNLSKKEALKYISEVDKQRIKWTKFLYGVNWRSPQLYDVVLNLEHSSFDFVCSMIEHAVKQKDFQRTPESQKALLNLLLRSQAKAVLATTPNIRLSEFDLRAEEGVITIVGKLRSAERIQKIIEIVSRVPGVKEVKSEAEINYRYQSIDA